ncbi:YjaG family protein [Flocculibacter collagenilyticus]|uniref:YjaG family protein n=1 Tax=Flocculibacter collagenilyticus TaxID=2744479 RepID=UPI0018F4D4D1|nr:YjaG family protein [Flocculibacter collagenilyticus]
MSKPKANNFQRIRLLSFEQQALIAATLLERMLPNYQLFSEVTEFGDYDVVANALDLIWQRLCIAGTKVNIEKLIEKVEPNIPEVEQFDMFGVYPAIDTLTAMISLLTALLNKDAEELLNVTKISQASVSKYIEYSFDVSEQEFDNHDVREHPLMQREIAFLKDTIDKVEPLKPSNETAKQLKALAKEDGMTNIGIEIA